MHRHCHEDHADGAAKDHDHALEGPEHAPRTTVADNECARPDTDENSQDTSNDAGLIHPSPPGSPRERAVREDDRTLDQAA